MAGAYGGMVRPASDGSNRAAVITRRQRTGARLRIGGQTVPDAGGTPSPQNGVKGKAVRGALLLGFCCLLFPFAALAQSSLNSISFQGVLNGANGQPLPNGNYPLAFRFYDSPTTSQWRYATTNQNVAVSDGVASIAVVVDPTIFDGTTRYLGIAMLGFNGGLELMPRVLVTAVPYAFTAARLADDANLRAQNLSLIRSDGQPTLIIGRSSDPGTGTAGYFRLTGEDGFLDFETSQSGTNWSRALRITRDSHLEAVRPDGAGVLTLGRSTGDQTGYMRLASENGFLEFQTSEDKVNWIRVMRLDNDRTTSVSVLKITGGSDLAEPFDVMSPPDHTAIVPGMVMVIDRERDGKLTPCARPYDTAVAGILSGANGLQPGMVMQAEGQPHAAGEHPLAMTGRVWCLADAAHGPIQRGDRLTTSPTVGHAMRAAEEARAPGAVIGKAMSELPVGRGFVLVLVDLQ